MRDRELCIFFVQMLKTVNISFINSELVRALYLIDVEYSVHKDQNSRDDNLCKSDVQVGIYLKSLLIKSKPAIFLVIE